MPQEVFIKLTREWFHNIPLKDIISFSNTKGAVAGLPFYLHYEYELEEDYTFRCSFEISTPEVGITSSGKLGDYIVFDDTYGYIIVKESDLKINTTEKQEEELQARLSRLEKRVDFLYE